MTGHQVGDEIEWQDPDEAAEAARAGGTAPWRPGVIRAIRYELTTPVPGEALELPGQYIRSAPRPPPPAGGHVTPGDRVEVKAGEGRWHPGTVTGVLYIVGLPNGDAVAVPEADLRPATTPPDPAP